MLDKIKAFFEFASTNGLWLPAAFDSQSKGPSVSLLFSHIANSVAIVAIIYLTYKDTMAGTIAAMLYASLMIAFYLLRKLTKVKFDLDEKSLDLENNEGK